MQSITARDIEYIRLRDVPRYAQYKDFVENLWTEYHPYADPNFKRKIARDFHHGFWEMYLSCAFIRKGLNLVPRSKRPERGPDICIKNGDVYIWIEAVAPLKGDGPDAIPEMFSSNRSFLVPENGIVLRYIHIIKKKYSKYKRHCIDGIIKDKDRYIIAINGRKVPFAFLDDEEDEMPLIMKTLFPFGDSQIVVDAKTLTVTQSEYEKRATVVKKLGRSESTNFFFDKNYNGISAVLFSLVDAVNKPDTLGDDFILVHNALAINPIKLGYLNIGKEFLIDKNGILQKYDHRKK
jgi:hypothetical protein